MKKTIYQFIIAAAVTGLLTGCGAKERNELRLQGIEKLNQQDYAQSITLFDQALETSKGRVDEFAIDVLKYKAEAEYQLENYQNAAEIYTILIDAESEKPEYLIRRSLSRLGAGQLDEALDDYTRAYPAGLATANLKEALLKLGEALINDDQESKAAVLYRQAVTDGIDDPGLYLDIGNVFRNHQDYEQAASYFEQGIANADGEMLKTLEFNLAAVCVYQQKYEQALQLFQEYQKKYGNDPEVEKEIVFLESR